MTRIVHHVVEILYWSNFSASNFDAVLVLVQGGDGTNIGGDGDGENNGSGDDGGGGSGGGPTT